VKDAYVGLKRTLGPTNYPTTCQVASVGCGGHRGSSCPCQPSCGQGLPTNEKCQKGLVPQAEVDRQTYITLRYYSNDKFKQIPLLRNRSYGSSRTPVTPLGLDQPDVTVTATHLLHPPQLVPLALESAR
jgi:hypothetical protein